MATEITAEARRLFAVVVEKTDVLGPEFRSREATDMLILAAAALCAEFMNRHTVLTTDYSEESPEPMWRVHCDGFGTDSWWPCWVSAQFAAVLAEKGIEHG
jgi:hypothetical protein